MTTGESWGLKHVSDDELLRALHSIRGTERQAVARTVAHLAEIEERRLHLRTGSPSLFHYCLHRLGMSEGEAFRRVTAARLARRFPMILDLLAEGDIHLCAICELRDYLTQQNHQELLQEAARKTRKQVQELLARRSPRGDISSTIRKLPAPKQLTTEVLAPPLAAPATPAAPSQPAAASTSSNAPTPPRSNRAVVEPLREDRYRVQLNASGELKRKLELARDLMSHSNPSGDLAVVVERALTLLIDKLQRERFAQAKQPRRRVSEKPDQRRIPNEVRRLVLERDGMQCTYVSPDGERCPSRGFLQFHHEHAWALGGKSTVENCRLLCASHNQLLAEQDFGRDHIERAKQREPTRSTCAGESATD